MSSILGSGGAMQNVPMATEPKPVGILSEAIDSVVLSRDRTASCATTIENMMDRLTGSQPGLAESTADRVEPSNQIDKLRVELGGLQTALAYLEEQVRRLDAI